MKIMAMVLCGVGVTLLTLACIMCMWASFLEETSDEEMEMGLKSATDNER